MTKQTDTKQGLFNHVVQHLLNQGRAALEVDNSCAYRTEDDLKCAVGFLIEDAYYLPSLEGTIMPLPNDLVKSSSFHKKSMQLLHVLEMSLQRRLQTDEVRMLRSLQSVHDNNKSEGDVFRMAVLRGATRVALEHQLTMQFTVDENKAMAT